MEDRVSLTHVIATVGPASSDGRTIARLIECGARVFRLNFSHGSLDDHAARLHLIREVSRTLGKPIAVLGDLQGPKVRLGAIAAPGAQLVQGASVRFTSAGTGARPRRGEEVVELPCAYDRLGDEVRPGHRLLINDGAVRLLVTHARPGEVIATVTTGGLVTSGKGINLPDSDLSIPSITDRDWAHARWAVENDLDFLALSFVRTASDVMQLDEGVRNHAASVGRNGTRVPIVAKIETPRAVEQFESIVQVADAIMVARGDLGVEMDLAQVPVIQKQLVAMAQDYGKPSIVATQMLESMITASAPTRAEASDVAGAIMDLVDAVMLSAETAVGAYPVLAVEQIRRIALRTEAYLASRPAASTAPIKLVESGNQTAAIAHGAWQMSRDLGAKVIAVWSQEGGGARYLSQNNFPVPIVAFTSDERRARQMQLLRGVIPVCVDVPSGLAAFTRLVDHFVRDTALARPGDRVLLMAGAPLGVPRVTNALALLEVGNPRSGFAAIESPRSP